MSSTKNVRPNFLLLRKVVVNLLFSRSLLILTTCRSSVSSILSHHQYVRILEKFPVGPLEGTSSWIWSHIDTEIESFGFSIRFWCIPWPTKHVRQPWYKLWCVLLVLESLFTSFWSIIFQALDSGRVVPCVTQASICLTYRHFWRRKVMDGQKGCVAQNFRHAYFSEHMSRLLKLLFTAPVYLLNDSVGVNWNWNSVSGFLWSRPFQYLFYSLFRGF